MIYYIMLYALYLQICTYVYTSEISDRCNAEPVFGNLLRRPGPGVDSQTGGPARQLFDVPSRQATEAGGIDSWESIWGMVPRSILAL